MNTPRFAIAAIVAALAAGPAFSQGTQPPTPGPLGQVSPMDSMAEGVLVELGQSMIPSLGGDASGKGAAEKKAAPAAAKAAPADEDADGGTDLVAIGGQIINPVGGAAPFRSATGMTLGIVAPPQTAGRQATFDTHVDGTGVAPAPVAKATGLSYVQSQKVEATLGGKAGAFGGDPKLSAGDADFASGGFGATANSGR